MVKFSKAGYRKFKTLLWKISNTCLGFIYQAFYSTRRDGKLRQSCRTGTLVHSIFENTFIASQVVEYRGEIVRRSIADLRERRYQSQGKECYVRFFFSLCLLGVFQTQMTENILFILIIDFLFCWIHTAHKSYNFSAL